MPRGRQVQPSSQTERSAQAEPREAAARRHPLLLAAVLFALAGWLSFLVWMAINR